MVLALLTFVKKLHLLMMPFFWNNGCTCVDYKTGDIFFSVPVVPEIVFGYWLLIDLRKGQFGNEVCS